MNGNANSKKKSFSPIEGPLKIGICGKREIAYSDRAEVAKEIEEKIRTILLKNNTKEFIGYTALAIGADTIFAEVVIQKFNQPIQIVLPFALNEYEKDFTDVQSADKLKEFINNYQAYIIVSDAIPANKVERNVAYFKIGKYLVDNCDEVIFVWDGLRPRGIGGTAEIMGYYNEKRNNEHIPYIHVHTKNEDSLDKQIMDQFNKSNKTALDNRNSYKKIWRSSILFGWIAVLLFAINTGFEPENKIEVISVTLELVLIAYIYYKIIHAKNKNYHGNYLSERMRAERFRILKYFYHAGIEVGISDSINEDIILLETAKQINDSVKRYEYKSNWYANYTIKSLIKEQQKYHQKKIKLIGNKAEFWEVINNIIAVAFLLSVIMHFINAAFEPFNNTEVIKEISIFLNIFLPASYAAIEGILYFEEWELLKKYSDATYSGLEKNMAELPIMIEPGDKDDNNYYKKQCSALNTISNTMLTDNKNWKLILEDKNKYQFVI